MFYVCVCVSNLSHKLLEQDLFMRAVLKGSIWREKYKRQNYSEYQLMFLFTQPQNIYSSTHQLHNNYKLVLLVHTSYVSTTL